MRSTPESSPVQPFQTPLHEADERQINFVFLKHKGNVWWQNQNIRVHKWKRYNNDKPKNNIHQPVHKDVCSWLTAGLTSINIQMNPDNSNSRWLEPKSISPGFALHIYCNLSPVTRTLNNSNLPLTRSDFVLPSGHFLFITLDNSNSKHRNVIQNTEFINVSIVLRPTIVFFYVELLLFCLFMLFCLKNRKVLVSLFLGQ